MMKLGFDINQNLKALPGTTSLVLRLRRLTSLFPVTRMAQITRQVQPLARCACSSVGVSWLFSQERHSHDCQFLGNSSSKGLEGRGGNSSQKRNQGGRGHKKPNPYSMCYLFALLIWKGFVSFGQNKKIKSRKRIMLVL